MATGTYTYTRIFPATTTDSTSDSLAGLIPSPADSNTLTQGLVIEFTPVVSGFNITFPDVAAVRGTNNLLNGFTTPGNRNSGGAGEVRRFPLGTTDFTTGGTLMPCTVEYAPGYGPDEIVENPNGKIRWLIKPASYAVPGQSLWPPDQLIVEDMTKIYTTITVNYA